MKNPEDEKINGLVGQFVVRPQIQRIARDPIKLSAEVLELITKMEPDLVQEQTLSDAELNSCNEIVTIENVIVNV